MLLACTVCRMKEALRGCMDALISCSTVDLQILVADVSTFDF